MNQHLGGSWGEADDHRLTNANHSKCKHETRKDAGYGIGNLRRSDSFHLVVRESLKEAKDRTTRSTWERGFQGGGRNRCKGQEASQTWGGLGERMEVGRAGLERRWQEMESEREPGCGGAFPRPQGHL